MSESDKMYLEEIEECRKSARKELSFIDRIKYIFDDELKTKVEEVADQKAKDKVRDRISNMVVGKMMRERQREDKIKRAVDEVMRGRRY